MQARVTMITKLYHQLPDEDPTGPESPPYEELLDSEEQVYKRRIKVGEGWTPIDFGWTSQTGCAFLHIVNTYSVRRRVTPRPDERQDDLYRILEVGKAIPAANDPDGRFPLKSGEEYVEPLFVLYVGQPITLSPLGQDRYRIRCRYGEGQCSLYCIPASVGSEI